MAGAGQNSLVLLLLTTVVALTAGSGLPPRKGECPVNDILAFSICQVGNNDSCYDDSKCAYGERCCSYGCGKRCIGVCPYPCPPGEECRIDRSNVGGIPPPPLPPPTCVKVNPCDNHPPCPYGKKCIIGYGGKPRCVPLDFFWKP